MAANFELSDEAKKQQAAAQAQQDKLKATQNARAAAATKLMGSDMGTGLATPDELMKHNAAEQAKTNAESADQAKRGGVETADAVTGAQGIAGFLGGKDTTTHFTAGHQADHTTAGNKAVLGSAIAAAQQRPTLGMNAAQLAPAAQSTAANIATAPQDQFRQQQLGLAGALGATANGTGGPSPAELQLDRSTDRNMNNALSMALASPGGNRMAALKNAGMQQAMISQDAASQGAELRANQTLQAQQALGGLLGQGRGQDVGLATDQAQLGQQTNLANQAATQQTNLTQGQMNQQAATTNLSSAVDQQKMKDDIIQKYRAMGIALDDQSMARELQQAQFNAGLLAQQSAADKGVSMQSAAQGGQVVGGLATALGSIAAGAASASDERVKFDVKPADSKIAELFAKAGAHDYKYKDPSQPLRGEGRFVSPMAQELERSEIGRSMVKDTPAGKVVDYGKGLGAMLAGMSMIFKKVQKLEDARA